VDPSMPTSMQPEGAAGAVPHPPADSAGVKVQ